MTGPDPDLAADRRVLSRLVDRLVLAGEFVPCRAGNAEDTAAWTSDSPADQRDAARWCHPCPALDTCHVFGRRWPEQAGVYGGLTEQDRRPRRGRPAKTTTTESETAA